MSNSIRVIPRWFCPRRRVPIQPPWPRQPLRKAEALEDRLKLLALLQGLFPVCKILRIGPRLGTQGLNHPADRGLAVGSVRADVSKRLVQVDQGSVGHVCQFVQLIPPAEPDAQGQVALRQLAGALVQTMQRPGQPMGQVEAEDGGGHDQYGQRRPEGLAEGQELLGGRGAFFQRQRRNQLQGREDIGGRELESEDHDGVDEEQQAEPEGIGLLEPIHIDPSVASLGARCGRSSVRPERASWL